MYTAAIQKLLDGEDLTEGEASAVMAEIMDGQLPPVRIAAFLTALSAKGETADELAGLAAEMRRRATTVEVAGEVLDTCGTGGSGLETPNTSTLSAFVLAAGGVRVAKHGNRAQSGRCGSMDVLEALEVPIELGPASVARLIEETGVGFMFAPRFHPAMAQAASVRRELGFRTPFNFLGPLANPASTQFQVLGVSDAQRARPMLEALRRLGVRRALVVHGSDGLDEITLTGPTLMLELSNNEVAESTLDPRTLGLELASPSAIVGGDRERNTRLFRSVLDGTETGPVRDLVALNASAGFFITGRTKTLREGLDLARELLGAGAPHAVFERHRAAAIRERERLG